MINMKQAAKPDTQDSETLLSDPDEPAYPWGLQIRLEEEQLVQLGIKGLPPVGAKVRIMAVAVVQSVSQSQEQGGTECRCISLQITDMDPPKPTAGMYDKSAMNA